METHPPNLILQHALLLALNLIPLLSLPTLAHFLRQGNIERDGGLPLAQKVEVPHVDSGQGDERNPEQLGMFGGNGGAVGLHGGADARREA